MSSSYQVSIRNMRVRQRGSRADHAEHSRKSSPRIVSALTRPVNKSFEIFFQVSQGKQEIPVCCFRADVRTEITMNSSVRIIFGAEVHEMIG